MKKIVFIPIVIAFLIQSCIQNEKSSLTDYSEYVNPFIGTGGHGHTYPGASLPFGMVQLSPDTRLTGWDGCSAYHYSDSIVYGFSHTHLSGTGVSDYGDILLMPKSGKLELLQHIQDKEFFADEFSHALEKAKPGYYQVYLKNNKINVELTTGKRVGMHSYTFEPSVEKSMFINLKHRDKVLSSSIKKVNNYEVEGHRVSQAWANEQHIYFVARFSEKITGSAFYSNDSLTDKLELSGTNLKSILHFNETTSDKLMVKLAISAVSIENARENLRNEMNGWNFEKHAENAKNEWNKELAKIEIQSTQREEMIVFYTALYHSFLNPNLFSDVNGMYRGTDLKVHHSENENTYTVFSLWDTYRATHPLFTITQQEKTKEFIKTFIKHYKHGGKLPIWELAGNYTGCMIGYHSIPVITDAILKEIQTEDIDLLYEAMKHSANQNELGLEEYRKYGYIPADMEPESVSKTLEYAYDDWCIAQLALKLNKADEYKEFIQRAQFYKNVFDHATGFMRPKMNGSFIEPFDPKEVTFHFTEANSWQYSFYVPQDVSGLIKLHGGDEKFASKLDDMFNETTQTTGRIQADITGLIGQYAHGNEPSHHMAYLYSYAGKPYKTQEKAHKILKEMYSNAPDGLSGNEDCGQMSSWYNLSALGFYPVNPADGIYVFGSPLFEKANLNFENNRRFEILTHRDSLSCIYIDSIVLNGKNYTKSYLTHEQLMQGGKIEFYMSSMPDKTFGYQIEDRPVSSILNHKITSVPVINTAKRTFYTSAKVEIASNEPGSKIYYTLDGSEPDVTSNLYRYPFYIYDTKTIRAICVSEEGIKSKITDCEIVKIPYGRTIEIKSKYSRQYTAGGDNGIIDYLRGPHDFRTGFWQGYQGQDFEAVVKLAYTQNVSYVAAGFLQEIRSWIWMPKDVSFYYSTDGVDFKELGTVYHQVADDDYTQQVLDFELNIEPSVRARYIKVRASYFGKNPDWHLGAGYESWLFIDEIIIK